MKSKDFERRSADRPAERHPGDPGPLLFLVRTVFSLVLAMLMVVGPATAVPARGSDPGPAVAMQTGGTGRPTYHMSLEAAYEAARQDGCPVLLIFRTEWDIFSRTFNETTLDSATFRNEGPCVHLGLLDVDRHLEQAADYQITFLPHLVLLTPDGKILEEQKGVLNPADLTQWIAAGVSKSNRGEWIGVSSSGDLGKFIEKFQTGADSVQDRERLIHFLGARHAGDRRMAADIIMADPSHFLLQLINNVDHHLLGIRVGVCDLIARVFPQAPLPDPWAPGSQREADAASLRQWWDKQRRDPVILDQSADLKKTGDGLSASTLPEPSTVRKLIQEVYSADAPKRTRAMTELTRLGPSVVPALNEAITEAESQSKDQVALLLEDTRWSIVVPDEIARALPHARRILARGTSEERQDLARSLGKLGSSSIPVLAELTRERDSLVQESAVRALAQINSRHAVRAMADMLSSENANLRMVTAQLLGKTDRPEAAQYLKQVLQDPNDVVAATAISALEEQKARNEGHALIACLSDTRWRIRAAAAEVIGKLEIGSAGNHLLGLLNDPDAFVVSAALRALNKLNIQAAPEQLKKAAQENPDLLQGIIDHILKSPPSQRPDILPALYNDADATRKREILTILGREELKAGNSGPFWNEFFSNVMADDDAEIRVLALTAMQNMWIELIDPYVEKGLADPDPEVRNAAVAAALRLACYHLGDPSGTEGPDHNILRYLDKTPEALKAEARHDGEETAEYWKEKIERAGRVSERHKTWNRLIRSRLGKPPDVTEVLALGVTGDALPGLKMLPAAITTEFINRLTSRSYFNFALDWMMSKAQWPDSEPVVRDLLQDPTAYLMLLAHAEGANDGLLSYMLDGRRMAGALGFGSSPLRMLLLKKLVSTQSVISLIRPEENARETVKVMMSAKDPFLKSLGAWAAGHLTEIPEQRLRDFLSDPNPWVRRSAVVSLIRRTEDLIGRERLFVPLLQDPSEDVVLPVLIGLLSTRLNTAASLGKELKRFKYETYDFTYFEYDNEVTEETTRPIFPEQRKPAWVKQLREQFEQRMSRQEDEILDLMGLVLAQHGELASFSSRLDRWTERSEYRLNAIQLSTIALSRDPQYLKILERFARSAREPDVLHGILRTVRHMRGEEVRQLRKQINRLLRAL